MEKTKYLTVARMKFVIRKNLILLAKNGLSVDQTRSTIAVINIIKMNLDIMVILLLVEILITQFDWNYLLLHVAFTI